MHLSDLKRTVKTIQVHGELTGYVLNFNPLLEYTYDTVFLLAIYIICPKMTG